MSLNITLHSVSYTASQGGHRGARLCDMALTAGSVSSSVMGAFRKCSLATQVSAGPQVSSKQYKHCVLIPILLAATAYVAE